jgi:hypothetical protein
VKTSQVIEMLFYLLERREWTIGYRMRAVKAILLLELERDTEAWIEEMERGKL